MNRIKNIFCAVIFSAFTVSCGAAEAAAAWRGVDI